MLTQENNKMGQRCTAQTPNVSISFVSLSFQMLPNGPVTVNKAAVLKAGLDTSCRCGHVRDQGGSYRKLSGVTVW